ncbi:ABC transporter permease subunit [Microbacterium sp. NPDC057658]|uniref:ABC transporter permease subunit n=1 Tax=unclassified Microbacterium TaxID=2609290 RepID=UPI00366FB95B
MRDALPIFRRALRESWRGTLGWTTGVAVVLLMYLPLFPSIGGNGQMQQIIDSLPPELVGALGYDQIGTGAGYAQGTFYGLIGFLLLTIAAIAWGAGAIAGAEEAGRLELDLAHGVSRESYALESAAAILVRLAWLGLFAGATVAMLNAPAQLDIEPVHIADTTVVFVGVTMVAGSAALFVGAVFGRRSWAVAAGSGVAVIGYAFNAVANQVVDAEWLRILSPYSWAFHESPLQDGFEPSGAIALWSLSLVLIVGSAWALRHRDIVG